MTLLDDLTRAAYNEYAATVEWKAYDGSSMLQFEDMRPLQRVAWRRAIENAISEYVKTQSHPAIPAVVTHWNLHGSGAIPRTRDPEVVAYVEAKNADEAE
jgi:hypothetical protein